MAHLEINCGTRHGGAYVPGQLLVFESMIFCAHSTDHLVSIRNYAPGRIVTFEGLEYTTDSHGEVILSGWMLGRVEDSSDIEGSTPKPISFKDIRQSFLAPPEEPSIVTPGDLASTPCLDASPISISEATSDLEPTPAQDLELSLDPHNGEYMLSYTLDIP